jgi:hypothetical protein
MELLFTNQERSLNIIPGFLYARKKITHFSEIFTCAVHPMRSVVRPLDGLLKGGVAPGYCQAGSSLRRLLCCFVEL